jgi:hypothetical protein
VGVGGTADPGYLKHVFGVNDKAGGTPTGAGTTILGSQFATVTTPVSVSSGIKLTDFNFTANAFSSTGFAVDGSGNVTLNAMLTPSATISVTTTSGNNLAITTGFMRITGTPGTFDLTGFVAQADGFILRVFNTSANNMNILNGSAASSVGNRITTLTGATVSTSGTGFASFVYDLTTTAWILTGVQS